MNRKYIVIGLLMTVLAFPSADSFVSAKSCKDQKSDLIGDLKEKIRSLCENDILPTERKLIHELTNAYTGMYDISHKVHSPELFDLIEYCEKGDWSVATKPRGSCLKQKDHIHEKYNTMIKEMEFLFNNEHALRLDTLRDINFMNEYKKSKKKKKIIELK